MQKIHGNVVKRQPLSRRAGHAQTITAIFGDRPLLDLQTSEDITTSYELTLTEERFAKKQERIIRDFGYGSTQGANAISQAVLPRLTEAIVETLKQRPSRQDEAFLIILKRLEPEAIALSTLQTCFHGVATEAKSHRLCEQLGRNVNYELWARGLVEFDKRLAANVERHVAKKHGGLKQRRQAARSIAKRAGYSSRGPWSRTEYMQVGRWLYNVTLETLPDIFVTAWTEDGDPTLTISEDALIIANAACASVMRRNPVFRPSVEPPRPWTGWSKGGPADARMQQSAPLIRSVYRETAGIVSAAIASGQMQPTLDAVNAIQATPWAINTKVLDVIRECAARQIVVPGLPRAKDYDTPKKALPWDDMDAGQRKLWKSQAEKVSKANRKLKADRISFAEDIAIAEDLSQHERFYCPTNLDWRGRVYALPHFCFSREDYVRSLFLFSDGEPIGEEGLYWLKVHVANCGDFDKISKRSFDERVAWVNRSIGWIKTIVSDPLYYQAWTGADTPFLFLAACLELVAALDEGASTFVTRLPVSFDGSCSGLQHLCAMTRAAEGEYVNLTPSEAPQDVYQRVADAGAIHVMEDAANGDELAKLWLAQGITRSLVKRNVMTYSYSSKEYGMGQQQEEDFMEPMRLKVLAEELPANPFGEHADKAHAAAVSPAAKYIARQVYGSIEEIVEKPALAMAFLQKLARALAHEGKPLRWTTPTGLPWSNRYHEHDTKRVKLWLHDNGVKVQFKTTVAVGHQKEIDKTRAANGVAPNFVHACDAAHLMLVVLAAAAEGIKHFALVHDSFGCLASRAGRFRQIIREQFVAMYEQHDVLAEVLEQARTDLTEANHGRLPEPVAKGPLNIREVLNAEYAFA